MARTRKVRSVKYDKQAIELKVQAGVRGVRGVPLVLATRAHGNQAAPRKPLTRLLVRSAGSRVLIQMTLTHIKRHCLDVRGVPVVWATLAHGIRVLIKERDGA